MDSLGKFRPLVYRGMVVIAGREFVINDIRLRNGQYEIIAIVQGPLPEFINEPMTIFGEDGQGVLQGGLFSYRAIECCERMIVTIPLRVTEVNPA